MVGACLAGCSIFDTSRQVAVLPAARASSRLAAQAAAVVGKAINLVALQRKANADKRLSVFFWNYPPGEKNMSASFMNLPRSFETTLKALRDAGYDTHGETEESLIKLLQRLLDGHHILAQR